MRRMILLTLMTGLISAAVPTAKAQQFVSVSTSYGCTHAALLSPYEYFDWTCVVTGLVLPFPPYLPVYAEAEVYGVCINEAFAAGSYTWWSQNIEAQVAVLGSGKTQATMDCDPFGACVSSKVYGSC